MKLNIFSKTTGIIFLSLLLCQCSLFSPSPYHTINMYEVEPCVATPKQKTKKTIFVAAIQAYPGLTTSAMRYRIQTSKVDYFTKNCWVASPASMLHPLLITHLKQYAPNTNLQGSSANTMVKTTLTRFEQCFPCNACSKFNLSMQVELVNAKTDKTIAFETIDVSETATTATPYGGVLAANEAVGKLFLRIDALILHNI